jgi:hypothetical protein
MLSPLIGLRFRTVLRDGVQVAVYGLAVKTPQGIEQLASSAVATFPAPLEAFIQGACPYGAVRPATAAPARSGASQRRQLREHLLESGIILESRPVLREHFGVPAQPQIAGKPPQFRQHLEESFTGGDAVAAVKAAISG